MPKIIVSYVKGIDWVCTKLGRLTMVGIFVMFGVLVLGSVSRNILNIPLSWTVEMAQFLLTGYYVLGGPYSLQLEEHVRMDLLYSRLSERTKAKINVCTSGFLIFYMSTMVYGSIKSAIYALEYEQRTNSLWKPMMAPIKVIMVIGIILMLLQVISILFKDIATIKGKKIS